MVEGINSAFRTAMTGVAFLFACVGCESTVAARRPAASSEPPTDKASPQPSSCSAWTAQVLRDGDAGNQRTWRDITIRSLATACDAVVPPTIRAAAARANGINDVFQRSRMMAAAVSASVDRRCPIADPFADARQLAKACPLPGGLRFRFDESVLMDLRAVDYGLLLILLEGFMRAAEYTEAAERLVLNFSLSAQIVGEDFRRKKGRPAPAHGK